MVAHRRVGECTDGVLHLDPGRLVMAALAWTGLPPPLYRIHQLVRTGVDRARGIRADESFEQQLSAIHGKDQLWAVHLSSHFLSLLQRVGPLSLEPWIAEPIGWRSGHTGWGICAGVPGCYLVMEALRGTHFEAEVAFRGEALEQSPAGYAARGRRGGRMRASE